MIAASTYTENSPLGWLQIPKNKVGIKVVTNPIIAYTNKTIPYKSGILAGECCYNNKDYLDHSGKLIAYRGLFLIDKKVIVRHQLINDFPLRRKCLWSYSHNRCLQYLENNGEVCQANCKKGMKASIKGVFEYISNI